MKNHLSAKLLIATGIIHNALGFVLGAEPLRAMLLDGLWYSTVVAGQTDFMREAIVWFLFSGFAMMMWGILLWQLERIPPLFAWSLLILCLIGVIIMPISGFWLVIPQAVYMLWQNKHHSPAIKRSAIS